MLEDAKESRFAWLALEAMTSGQGVCRTAVLDALEACEVVLLATLAIAKRDQPLVVASLRVVGAFLSHSPITPMSHSLSNGLAAVCVATSQFANSPRAEPSLAERTVQAAVFALSCLAERSPSRQALKMTKTAALLGASEMRLCGALSVAESAKELSDALKSVTGSANQGAFYNNPSK